MFACARPRGMFAGVIMGGFPRILQVSMWVRATTSFIKGCLQLMTEDDVRNPRSDGYDKAHERAPK